MPNARGNKSPIEGSQHFLWRKNRNAAEPSKILDIECEQVPDSMHRCYQARVMDLDTRDLRCNNDSAPLMMCCFAFGGKRELGFDQGCAFIGLGNREGSPIAL